MHASTHSMHELIGLYVLLSSIKSKQTRCYKNAKIKKGSRITSSAEQYYPFAILRNYQYHNIYFITIAIV